MPTSKSRKIIISKLRDSRGNKMYRLGQAELLKEPFKSLWLDTPIKAEDFKYVELVEKNSMPALIADGYEVMDKIRCYNKLSEKGMVFLGRIKFLGDEKD